MRAFFILGVACQIGVAYAELPASYEDIEAAVEMSFDVLDRHGVGGLIEQIEQCDRSEEPRSFQRVELCTALDYSAHLIEPFESAKVSLQQWNENFPKRVGARYRGINGAVAEVSLGRIVEVARHVAGERVLQDQYPSVIWSVVTEGVSHPIAVSVSAITSLAIACDPSGIYPIMRVTTPFVRFSGTSPSPTTEVDILIDGKILIEEDWPSVVIGNARFSTQILWQEEIAQVLRGDSFSLRVNSIDFEPINLRVGRAMIATVVERCHTER